MRHKRVFLQGVYLAFLLKILLLFTVSHFFQSADELSIYHAQGTGIAATWHGNPPENFYITTVSRLYVYALGGIYYLFGSFMSIGKLLNIFVSFLTAIVLFFLAKEMFDEEVGVFASLLFLFLPSILFWTSTLLRESFVLFFIATTLYVLTRLVKQPSLFSLVIIVVCLFALYSLRNHMVFLFIFLTVITLSFLWMPSRYGIVVLVLLLIAVPSFYPVLPEQYKPDAVLYNALGQVYGARTWIIHTGSASYYPDADITSPKRLMAFLPKGYGTFFFAPFPWLIARIQVFLYLLVNTPEYFLLPFLLYGVYTAIRKEQYRRRILPIVLYLFLTITLYAVADANVGSLLRHKIQATTLMLPFAAKGLINTGFLEVWK